MSSYNDYANSDANKIKEELNKSKKQYNTIHNYTISNTLFNNILINKYYYIYLIYYPC